MAECVMAAALPRFTLYSRNYCHLCHDMLAALEALGQQQGLRFEVDVVDVDADPQLEARYDELVPVLAAPPCGSPQAEPQELCHYFLDVEAVLAYLHRLGQEG